MDILGTLQDIRQNIADLYTQNYVSAETYQIITNTVNREIDTQLRQPVSVRREIASECGCWNFTRLGTCLHTV